MKREKLPKLRAGGNLGNASKKFSVFIRSCFTRCHFKIWNISFIAICHFHIWPEQLIFCADAAHKTNSVPVASNQAHNWTTRLIGVSTIFTVSINLIVVGQTVYCPNLGIKICKRLTYKERSRLLLPQYRHFYPCNICSHCWGVHVDRVVDVTDVGSKHPPDKKSDPVKRTIFFVYFENLYTGNKLLQKCLQSDYYERWKAEWKSIYQIPLILSAFLNVQYASFITQQPYFRVPIQEPPGCGSTNNWM